MCLPATGERAADPEGPPWGLGSENPQPRRLALGLPPGKATTSGRPSRVRPRPPIGALATPEGPRKAASPRAGGPALRAPSSAGMPGLTPGGGGCRLLPHPPQPPVESRAWSGRRVLTQHPHRAWVLRSGPSCPQADWTMSACQAASGAPAPSILKCSPHGTLERTRCHARAGKGRGHPRNPRAGRPCSVLTPPPAARPGGSGCRSPGVPLFLVP